MKDKLKNKKCKALIITLIIIAVLGVLSLGENGVISTVFNGSAKGLFQLSAAATSGVDSASMEDLRAENKALKEENAKLRQQLADYIDTKAENERLWQYYELKKEHPSYSIVPANVIRRDTNDDFYSFTLDIGSSDGVTVNSPVIGGSGLVGWVCSVDAATCKVKTILSPDTKATAQDKQSSDSGILSGSATLCDKNLTAVGKLAENNAVRKGDMIVTAGTGGVYPAGLLIGEVQSIEFNRYDASRSAIVKPYEDVRSITAAAVITDFDAKHGGSDED